MNTGVRLATAALAVSLAVGSALAQAPAAPPSAEQLRLAHEVFDAAGGASNMIASIRTAMNSALAQTQRIGTPEQRQSREAIMSFVQDRIIAYTPEIISASERSYATVMTEAELRDLLAFYRTPTGHALAERLPRITAVTMAGVQPVLLKMQHDVLEKACSMTACTPEQRAQLAALGQR